MRALRATCIGCIAAASLGTCLFASQAQADWGDRYHRWHPHDGWYRPGAPPALIVVPQSSAYVPPAVYNAPSVAYAPSRAVYLPPPLAYTAPPAYYAPGVPFDLTVR